MQKKIKNLLLWMIACFICAGGYSLSFAGVIDPIHKWDKPEIRVCWAVKGSKFHNCDGAVINIEKHNFALSSSEYKRFKNLIKVTVSSEFKKESVGIQFTEWDECPKFPEIGLYYDAVISLVTENDKLGNFGGGSSAGNCKPEAKKYLGIPSTGFQMYVGQWNKTLAFEDRVKISALHEFGHLAGLHHEDYIHEDPERIKEWKLKVVAGYNPVSVMSYEFLDLVEQYGLKFTQKELYEDGRRLLGGTWQNSPPSALINDNGDISIKPALSAGDVLSLQCLYGITSANKCITK